MGDAIVKISSSKMFTRGRIAFLLEWGKLYIFYKKWGIRYVSSHAIEDHHTTKKRMRDTVIDLYYDHEWDGTPLTYEQIWVLLGLGWQGASNFCKMVLNKLSYRKEMLRW